MLGGFERFAYDDTTLTGTLSGSGATLGAYAGARLGDSLKADATLAWSSLNYDAAVTGATGSFTGSRWLASAGLSGSQNLGVVVLTPSARLFGVWENDAAWTDSTSASHAAYGFATGELSAGSKASLPTLLADGATLTPSIGAFADYVFAGSGSDIGQGLAGRLAAGLAYHTTGGGSVSVDANYGGLGTPTRHWTLSGHAGIGF